MRELYLTPDKLQKKQTINTKKLHEKLKLLLINLLASLNEPKISKPIHEKLKSKFGSVTYQVKNFGDF